MSQLRIATDARGYVSVPDYAAYDLGKPLSVRLNRTDEGPGYMMSVFHQLHCLVSKRTCLVLYPPTKGQSNINLRPY